MPTLPNTPSGVISCKMHYQPSIDSHVYSRFELGYNGTSPTTAQMVTLAGDVQTQVGAHLSALFSASFACTDTTVIDLQNQATPEGFSASNQVGTRSGTQVPLNFTSMINFTPNRRYRGGKPKIFLPFGTQPDISNPATWTSTFVTAVNAGWNAFITALTGITVNSGVTTGQVAVSYFGPPTIPNTGKGKNKFTSTQRTTPLVMPISAIACAVTAGSQRRRLRP